LNKTTENRQNRVDDDGLVDHTLPLPFAVCGLVFGFPQISCCFYWYQPVGKRGVRCERGERERGEGERGREVRERGRGRERERGRGEREREER
jgi:hypothetical protein